MRLKLVSSAIFALAVVASAQPQPVPALKAEPKTLMFVVDTQSVKSLCSGGSQAIKFELTTATKVSRFTINPCNGTKPQVNVDNSKGQLSLIQGGIKLQITTPHRPVWTQENLPLPQGTKYDYIEITCSRIQGGWELEFFAN